MQFLGGELPNQHYILVRIPDPQIIRESIELARHAPNHHRTEPARFYLLDSVRIQKKLENSLVKLSLVINQTLH